MLPTLLLPNVASLSFLGFLGVTATITVTSTVLFTWLTGAFKAGAATVPVAWDTLPLVCGIFAFSYSGHGVFPTIKRAMKNPEEFGAVGGGL